MRRPIRGLLTLAVVAGLALSAVGQEAAGKQARPVPMSNAAQQARLPYTAEFKTTRVKTLADGSTITHESTEVLARDSHGRTYNLSSSISQNEEQTVHTSINISDPVAKTHTFWFVPGQRVTVVNTFDAGAASAPCGVNTTVAMPQATEERTVKPTREDLGKQTFQGIEARGNRTTTSFPAGAIGNSEPLLRTDEVWFSSTPGLSGINVRQVNDDPQTGKTTRELVKFTQGEPDLTLFQPPDGYETLTQETHAEVRCP
jgi:hypothetical protein